MGVTKAKKRAWQSTAFFAKRTKSNLSSLGDQPVKRRSWEFAKKKREQNLVRRDAAGQLSHVQAAVFIAEEHRIKEERDALEQTRLTARTELVSLLRQQPGIYQVLGLQLLGRAASDVEVLRAFALVDTPAKVLRTAGCAPSQIATVMALKPIAYQDVPPPKPKTEEEQHHEIVYDRGKWLLVVILVLSGLLLLAGFALGIAAIWYMQDEAGWIYSRCEIAKYTNGHGNCTGSACLFNILVWKRGSAESTFVRNWQLPVKEISDLGELKVDGEAFRCCNLNGYQCCGFYAADDELYCDAWGYRVDPSGRQCPESPWACRYQLATDPSEGEDEIMRLEEASVAEKKPIWSLAAAGIATSSIAACFFCLSAGCRDSMLNCGSCVRRLCEGDRDDQIALMEAARLQGLGAPVQPPQALPRPPPRPASKQEAPRGGALTPPASALSGSRAVSRSSSRPATGGSRPSTGRSRPSTGRSRPSTGGSRPSTGRSRVSFEEPQSKPPGDSGGSVKRDIRAKRGAMIGEHATPARNSQAPELEVVDVTSDEMPLPQTRRSLVPTHKLRACAVGQPGELFRPIVTPLAHATRGKRHHGRRAPVHKEELPGVQGREAWRVIDL